MHIARFAVLFTIALVGLSPSVSMGHAQSLPTASKSAQLSAFGGYLASSPDYGPFIKAGVGAGADFTIFPRIPVALSLEVRGHEAFGTDVTEKALFGGLRVQKDLRLRYHPYVDLLIGTGEIVFHPEPYPDYHADRSKAYSYGGGIDIDVAKHFGAKFDIQRQYWNLGNNPAVSSSGNFRLDPNTYLVGVTYTIPFRKLNRHGDFR